MTSATAADDDCFVPSFFSSSIVLFRLSFSRLPPPAVDPPFLPLLFSGSPSAPLAPVCLPSFLPSFLPCHSQIWSRQNQTFVTGDAEVEASGGGGGGCASGLGAED